MAAQNPWRSKAAPHLLGTSAIMLQAAAVLFHVAPVGLRPLAQLLRLPTRPFVTTPVLHLAPVFRGLATILVLAASPFLHPLPPTFPGFPLPLARLTLALHRFAVALGAQALLLRALPAAVRDSGRSSAEAEQDEREDAPRRAITVLHAFASSDPHVPMAQERSR
jgi:hypothetical protein